jgi:hypothetical protein
MAFSTDLGVAPEMPSNDQTQIDECTLRRRSIGQSVGLTVCAAELGDSADELLVQLARPPEPYPGLAAALLVTGR